jgi:beta-N-acetylhexosaminidase
VGLSPRQKAAQTLMVGFDGTAATAELEDFVEALCPGGVILFARNVSPPTGLAALVSRLQAASIRGCGLPLLVAVDQEGGPVARLREPFFSLPGQVRLGEMAEALGEEAAREAAYLAAVQIGSEMAAVGINLDLAPVLDVCTRQDSAAANRCFSHLPERVAMLGAATVRGLQDGGVAACAKHFPGHGDTAIDTHRDLPVVEHDLPRLEAVELVPYRAAIEAGVAAVMTTHIVFSGLDPALPATLSGPVVTGLLRERLSFGGLVLSDDLQMGAIAKRWGLAQAAELALRAGCDQVLVCNMLGRDDPLALAAHLAEIAEDDAELAARIEESAARVAAAKGRWAAREPEGREGLAARFGEGA